ncbi:probable serine/threonine-protein kinase drkD isoform X2 [Dysidea avara]|uniref:probable serine/threonine-protein kinase drkD isoform X2 n=1 Tax=Dysidea avara TaxID=196820 RepID=UPI00331F752F
MATFPIGDGSFTGLILDGVKETGREIGIGAYGRVFEVDYYGTPCAAKEVHSILVRGVGPEGFQRVRDSFLRECQQCAELRHPNVVQFLGVYYKPGSPIPILVMEKMDESLRSTLERHQNIPMSIKLSILLDVSLGLRYLHCHKPPIVHRDLSSNNILLSTLLRAKISDLGVAKVVRPDSKKSLTKVPGTADFMPPEAQVDMPGHYGTSLDVFSYGGVMLHTITQEWPTPSAVKQYDPKTKKVRGFTEVERRQSYIDKMPEETKELKPVVISCLDEDPDSRPSINNVCDSLKKMKEDQPSAVDMNPLSLLAQKAQLEGEVISQKVKTDQDINQLKIDIDRQKRETSKQKREAERQRIEAEQQRMEAERQKEVVNRQKKQIDDLQQQLKHLTPLSQTNLAYSTVEKVKTHQLVATDQRGEGNEQRKEVNHVKPVVDLQRRTNGPPAQRKDQIQMSHPQTKQTAATNMLKKDSPEFSLALQSGRYQLNWTTCSPLPTAMYWAHATVIKSVMYIGGGVCPDRTKIYNVYAYHLEEDRWDSLPPLQQYCGVPVNITDKLTSISGYDSATHKATNKVTTFSDNSWRNDIFPNLLIARLCPAVVPYQSYIIVAGGYGDDGTLLDTIEVLDINILQWRIVNTHLPQPMCGPSATMCGESLVIVGFDTADNKHSNKTFLIDINEITSKQQLTTSTGEDNKWSRLADAPYFKTTLIPNSSPPVIIGGDDEQDKTTNDITLYDDVTKSWRRVSSIPTNCSWTTVTIINNVIIVAGGCVDNKTIETAEATSLTSVVMGHLEEIN